METIKKHKKEIIISLITGIFLFYVQPALNFLGDLFIKTYIVLSDTFSNDYYSSIAKNDPNTFADFSNFLLIIILSIILLYSIFYVDGKKRELKKRIERTLDDIVRAKKSVSDPAKNEEEKSREKFLEEIEALETNATQIRDNLFRRDNKLLSLYIMSFFFMALLFTNYAMKKSIFNANLEFRNEIIKIKPFISDEQLKTIEAKWVSMKNKTDNDQIIKLMKDIKLKNAIE
jgi:hypothetical protein